MGKDEGNVNEEGTTIEVTQNSQHGETVAVEETGEAQTPKKEDKKEEMKHKAEEAAKKALDSVEKIAKEAAAKFGAFFHHKGEKKEEKQPVVESKEEEQKPVVESTKQEEPAVDSKEE